MHTHTNTYKHIHTHIHTYTHTYIYTHTHTYAHTDDYHRLHTYTGTRPMSCYTCDKVRVQRDGNTKELHTDSCNYFSSPVTMCKSDEVLIIPYYIYIYITACVAQLAKASDT